MQDNIPQISVEHVKKSLDEHEDMMLLDVRTQEEFARGRIDGSINIPLQEVANSIEKLIPDKQQKIYIYCLSGSRSIMAVKELLEKGYTNVYNVTSGMLAWRVKQYPTVHTN